MLCLYTIISKSMYGNINSVIWRILKLDSYEKAIKRKKIFQKIFQISKTNIKN